MLGTQLLQRMIGRAVAGARTDSGRAGALLRELEGRRLGIAVLGTPLRLLLECRGEELRLSDVPDPESADARIAGAPLSLLSLLAGRDRAALHNGAVRLDGDAEVAQRFAELLPLLRPDPEHLLSGALGRSAAHLLMRGAREAADWGRHAAATQFANLAEYLAYETGDVVSRPEGEPFLQAVEHLREQIDRVDARLQDLERRERALAGGVRGNHAEPS